MTPYSIFQQLHQQPKPLLIGNVWNVQSAKVYEQLAFQAIGTSSAALAHSLGYEDGEQLPFEELRYLVQRIIKNTSLPLTVDIESGYGKEAGEVAANIRQLQALGVAGINIEDSNLVNGERQLKATDEFSNLLKGVRKQLQQHHAPIFINLRCDAFLLNVPDALTETLDRITMYEQCGIDGIFLPGLTNLEHIKTIVAHTQLPLNVMCLPRLPHFNELAKAGVKRISMGNFMNQYVYKAMQRQTEHLVQQQSFSSLF